jgi:hypothetical protein
VRPSRVSLQNICVSVRECCLFLPPKLLHPTHLEGPHRRPHELTSGVIPPCLIPPFRRGLIPYDHCTPRNCLPRAGPRHLQNTAIRSFKVCTVAWAKKRDCFFAFGGQKGGIRALFYFGPKKTEVRGQKFTISQQVHKNKCTRSVMYRITNLK